MFVHIGSGYCPKADLATDLALDLIDAVISLSPHVFSKSVCIVKEG